MDKNEGNEYELILNIDWDDFKKVKVLDIQSVLNNGLFYTGNILQVTLFSEKCRSVNIIVTFENILHYYFENVYQMELWNYVPCRTSMTPEEFKIYGCKDVDELFESLELEQNPVLSTLYHLCESKHIVTGETYYLSMSGAYAALLDLKICQGPYKKLFQTLHENKDVILCSAMLEFACFEFSRTLFHGKPYRKLWCEFMNAASSLASYFKRYHISLYILYQVSAMHTLFEQILKGPVYLKKQMKSFFKIEEILTSFLNSDERFSDFKYLSLSTSYYLLLVFKHGAEMSFFKHDNHRIFLETDPISDNSSDYICRVLQLLHASFEVSKYNLSREDKREELTCDYLAAHSRLGLRLVEIFYLYIKSTDFKKLESVWKADLLSINSSIDDYFKSFVDVIRIVVDKNLKLGSKRQVDFFVTRFRNTLAGMDMEMTNLENFYLSRFGRHFHFDMLTNKLNTRAEILKTSEVLSEMENDSKSMINIMNYDPCGCVLGNFPTKNLIDQINPFRYYVYRVFTNCSIFQWYDHDELVKMFLDSAASCTRVALRLKFYAAAVLLASNSTELCYSLHKPPCDVFNKLLKLTGIYETIFNDDIINQTTDGCLSAQKELLRWNYAAIQIRIAYIHLDSDNLNMTEESIGKYCLPTILEQSKLHFTQTRIASMTHRKIGNLFHTLGTIELNKLASCDSDNFKGAEDLFNFSIGYFTRVESDNLVKLLCSFRIIHLKVIFFKRNHHSKDIPLDLYLLELLETTIKFRPLVRTFVNKNLNNSKNSKLYPKNRFKSSFNTFGKDLLYAYKECFDRFGSFEDSCISSDRYKKFEGFEAVDDINFYKDVAFEVQEFAEPLYCFFQGQLERFKQ